MFGMNDKNNKNNENKCLTVKIEDHLENHRNGIYLRDDHCDWGSSGMNEFTNEYGESK
tara:strand:- start:145 stop:318 length:174 start_codon:yes stop_codon:yes gene_type:complete